jgi:hypothetical protein
VSRTDYRTLINQGRKAGLRTSELYDALAARRPEVGDRNTEQADGNGFVSGYGRNGQRVYGPLLGRPRS